jgi:3-oxoadipate enol-lactonase
MNAAKEMVDCGEFKLAAFVSGREAGPWIVLSNSVGANAAMWKPQLPLLEKHYRVLRYDARGHGESDAPKGPYSFPDLIDDIIALMDHFGITKADYMGLSLGGMTGIGLVLAHPERVERFVCCDARADASPPFLAMWDSRMAAIRTGGMEAILDVTLERWFRPDFAERDPQLYAEAQKMVLATDPDGYCACAEALKTLDYINELKTIKVPTLYVVGADDAGATPATMRDMADRTPGSAYAEIPAAAHIANMEQPAAFDRAIAGYLRLS